MVPRVSVPLSGERFRVVYRLTGDESLVRETAKAICFEQTVEFPDELIPDGDIRDNILGRIESIERLDEAYWDAVISYAVETTGLELTQLLNVVFGNISLRPGVRAERLDLSPTLLSVFSGPRFGREGFRELLKVPSRPLLCTALKPMGLPPADLASLAYQFALGGIDIIKDDHGLANQPFARFDERVQRCAEVVARANNETGFRCMYMPNVTGPVDRIISRSISAKKAGVGGLLISPGIVGFDMVRHLAADDRVALPIMAHPAFGGSFVANRENGISHRVLFGELPRLLGADATIFPNYGGRFSFSRDECVSIAEGSSLPWGEIKPILPAPGGGMSLARVPEMIDVYGREVILLIGGGLHGQGKSLMESARGFRRLVEAI